jgi:hypothetical protein
VLNEPLGIKAVPAIERGLRVISEPNSEYEDLSDTLLTALSLESGQFART